MHDKLGKQEIREIREIQQYCRHAHGILREMLLSGEESVSPNDIDAVKQHLRETWEAWPHMCHNLSHLFDRGWDLRHTPYLEIFNKLKR